MSEVDLGTYCGFAGAGGAQPGTAQQDAGLGFQVTRGGGFGYRHAIALALIAIVVSSCAPRPPQSRPVIEGLGATFGTSLAEVRSMFPDAPPLTPNQDWWFVRPIRRDPIVAFLNYEKAGVAFGFDANHRVVGIYLEEPFAGTFRGIRLNSLQSAVVQELGTPHKTRSYLGQFRLEAFLVNDYVVVVRFRNGHVDWMGFHLSLPQWASGD